jgi:hypothetical protein
MLAMPAIAPLSIAILSDPSCVHLLPAESAVFLIGDIQEFKDEAATSCPG